MKNSSVEIMDMHNIHVMTNDCHSGPVMCDIFIMVITPNCARGWYLVYIYSMHDVYVYVSGV